MSSFSSTNDSHALVLPCMDSPISGRLYLVFTGVSVAFLLPVSIWIVTLGFQHWSRLRSSPEVMSFSDFYTYHLAVVELAGVSGIFISTVSGLFDHSDIFWWGAMVSMFPWCGQMLFPTFTCVERYLAVVQPVTYMRLRQASGVRLRNASAALVWLFCISGMLAVMLFGDVLERLSVVILVLMLTLLTVVMFCSLSVLRVLIRPRPGEAARAGPRLDQTKQRAFRTIVTIMGVLVLKFGGYLVCIMLGYSPLIPYHSQCVAKAVSVWFNLLSSLALPLLFLHRAGKLPGRKPKPGSG
ncbi:uncharacterized protein V6R79_009413 [Siganus canaliculatus]